VTPDGCVRFANSDSPPGTNLLVQPTVPNNSVESCISACQGQGQGYVVAGLENAVRVSLRELSSTDQIDQTSLLKSVPVMSRLKTL
jgi:hypothetical protein